MENVTNNIDKEAQYIKVQFTYNLKINRNVNSGTMPGGSTEFMWDTKRCVWVC